MFNGLPSDYTWADGTDWSGPTEGSVVDILIRPSVGEPSKDMSEEEIIRACMVVLVHVEHDVLYDGIAYQNVWQPASALTITETNKSLDYELTMTSHPPLKNAFGEIVVARQKNKQILSVEGPPNYLRTFLVRFTSIKDAIGFTGYNFSKEMGGKLAEGETEEEFTKRWNKHWERNSRKLRDDDDYNYFISYRWMMGRFFLWISANVTFNHLAAAVIAFAISVLVPFFAGIIHTSTGTHENNCQNNNLKTINAIKFD